MEQLDGGVTAVQLSDVLLDVVPDAVRPEGADGDAVQLALDEVVTVIDELCPDVPFESVAATVNVYVVDADKPVTEKLVDVDVPIDVPDL